MDEYLAALNALEDGILIVNSDDRAVFLNQALCEALSLEPAPASLPLVNGKKRSDIMSDRNSHIKLRYTKSLPDQLTMEVYSLRDNADSAELAQLRDRLMSRISHEVKTPLTSVLGFAYMMQSKPDAPQEKREKWASFIYSKSESLNRLVENILDFDALHDGRLTLTRRPTDLRELIQNVISELAEAMPEHHVDLVLPDHAILLEIDVDRMFTVLYNLISQALKVTPTDQVVKVEMRESNEGIEVAVTDRGPGLDEEQQKHIFDPFSAEPGSNYQPGKGLWLPLAKALIESHDGKMWFESTPAIGNTFHFTIPYSTDSDATAEPSRAQNPAGRD
jgi:K+-sensing histidine kinase KdpD